MKKIFSFLAIAMAVIMPMSTNAATNEIVLENGVIPCVQDALDSTKFNCTVTLNTTGGSETSVAINITEHNASVDTSSIEAGKVWNVDTTAYPNLTFTSATETGNTGSNVLFTFSYTKATNGEDCYVTVNGKSTKNVVTKDTDTPVENEQTGVTLPYIFLGAALLIAGYAFVATKNKSKMYKI